MKKVTYRELKATFPEEKKSVEAIYGRIVPVRKLSYWMTIPLINSGVSAFQASVMSMFIALAACICIAVPNAAVRTIGVILVPIWHIFDCVDGNIARYNKTASDYGGCVDAICGYFIWAYLPLALGIASYNCGSRPFGVSPVLFIIMGALASVSQTLMRLIHQKYAFTASEIEKKTGQKIEKGENQYTLTGFNRFRKMMGVELGIVGAPMFFLFICPVFNLFWVLTAYYFCFFTASLMMITAVYLRKCNRPDPERTKR